MAAASLSHFARPPRKLGRYELIAPLATGGMAELFLGRLRGRGGFEKLVAIKQMKAHLSDDPGFVDMFLDEGRIAARLTHPNICQVYELGDDDGQLYMAMEYVPGIPLSTILAALPRTSDGFDLRVSAGILVQVSEGVHFAHEHKADGGVAAPIVHRDVSPTNLLVTGEGVCKLVDFGIAKVLTEVSHTRTGVLKGKPAYMAPEQIRAEPVDRRSDVFALGVVLWECIAGKRLFQGDSDFLIWQQITQTAVPRLRELRPEVPPGVDEVVQRACAKDPAQRYESARAFAADLRRSVASVGGPLEPAGLAMYLTTLCADAFAARNALVAQALAGEDENTDEVRRVTARNAAIAAAAGAEPTATASIRLREHTAQMSPGASTSMPLGFDASDDDETLDAPPRRSRWPLAMLAGAAAIAGVLLALALAGGIGGDARKPHALAAQQRQPQAQTEAQAQQVKPSAGTETEMEGETVAEPDPPVEIRRPSKPQRPPTTKKQAAAPPVQDTTPGYYLVDSTPYARIFIDGKDHGETPLFRVALSPGKHQVKAVLGDGRKKQFTIDIKSGKDLSSGRLKW
ncbi:MAG TPA: serine/threonine-protein kinase [Kofleriaceae bacterium]|nr:serine/threonine-protein kinase [Kofleriaceae bacterium]